MKTTIPKKFIFDTEPDEFSADEDIPDEYGPESRAHDIQSFVVRKVRTKQFMTHSMSF